MCSAPRLTTHRQTFSLTIGGVAQHLISYYKIEDVEQGRLRSPSSLPELASLTISPEYLDKTHFRNPPKVEIGVDGIPRYRGEADDVDISPRLLPAPLSNGYYADSDAGPSKRAKRYDPYNINTSSNPPNKRRSKKNNSASSQSEATGADSPTQPLAVPSVHQPQPAYADPNVSTHYPPYGYYQMTVPHVYSPAPYPPLPAPHTGSSPPQESPSPPPVASAPVTSPSGYSTYATGDSAPSAAASVYPSYYTAPPPPSHGYTAYPTLPWPSYSSYPPSAGAPQTTGTNIQEITESDVRSSAGGGGGGA